MAVEPHQLGLLLTAMVTPFRADGSVDYEGAASLARYLVENGSDGVVVSGTTGEAPTLTDAEDEELVRRVKPALNGGTLVAGTGGNSTAHAIELSQRAVAAGADAILCVVPYYNKPTQEGIYRHFRAIAESVDRPVILYNVPGRTGVNMTANTTLRCAEVPGIAGIKEASGDLEQVGRICAARPKGFSIWSGNDSDTLPILALGGEGVICVVSHLAGPAIREMLDAFGRGDVARARQVHLALLPLMSALMTAASNPIPVKSVLNRLGFPAGPFRLPLVPLAEADLDQLMEVVRAVGELVTFAPGAGVA